MRAPRHAVIAVMALTACLADPPPTIKARRWPPDLRPKLDASASPKDCREPSLVETTMRSAPSRIDVI